MRKSFIILSLFFFFGCQSADTLKVFHSAPVEAEWIRNGEPLIFEGGKWYPADAIENLLDSEVYQIGEYNGVEIFVEMTDVRPFERLYTKFAKNKFRFFEKKQKP